MDDLISRQAAINALENTECELLSEEWDDLTDAIMNVPSAQPEWNNHTVACLLKNFLMILALATLTT